ncbi:hypothetical protein SASPL_108239 [Salvia splendens]|uniref:Uncharacterized protein n=1 Tax=Salvia splendens TaxID=180675 RepID=A0A8X8YGC1_SALSN|nr:hypothetical protein SASPL_108239 [Salvia splendens]
MKLAQKVKKRPKLGGLIKVVIKQLAGGPLHSRRKTREADALESDPQSVIKDNILEGDTYRHEKIDYVLDKPIGVVPIGVVPSKESSEFATFDAAPHEKHVENTNDAQCVMLSSLSLELQRQHEHKLPYEILKHLESLYASQAKIMEYEILRDLFKCKLHDEGKVSEHVLKMIGLIERLASIGTVLPPNVTTVIPRENGEKGWNLPVVRTVLLGDEGAVTAVNCNGYGWRMLVQQRERGRESVLGVYTWMI